MMNKIIEYLRTILDDKMILKVSYIILILGATAALINTLMFGVIGLFFAAVGLVPYIVCAILCLFFQSKWIGLTSGILLFLTDFSIHIYVLLFLIGVLEGGSQAPLLFMFTPFYFSILTFVCYIMLFFIEFISKKLTTTK